MANTNNFFALTEGGLRKIAENVKSGINNTKLVFDIDEERSRIGFKEANQQDFTYTPSLIGKQGTSITDVYIEESTDELIVVVSDDPLTDAVSTYGDPITLNTITESVTEITIKPNVMYTLGKVAQLTIALEAPTNPNICNEYMLQFETSPAGAVVVFEDEINWIVEPDYQPNMLYQVSILNGVGVIAGVSNT